MINEPIDEKEVFNSARRLAVREERVAYLQQVCGHEPKALSRILELLNVYFQESSFLESPAVAPGAAIDTPAEAPGTVIGPYKLLEQIGEGGMGLVFMAEQSRPVRRRVALKVIKPGMDTRQVVARFEAERQALALMDHPNIAKVFDGGTTDSGRTYFVMELVRGVPITEFCDQRQLTTRQRLELFVTVCQAVQHAHQKGIIHRDLKPSNVLVTLHDTVAVPKIIDFGIAKATTQPLTERTLFTNFAQMIGTPLYMSPEQAEMNGLDVDTRSDVYALGVLLYELLTGTTPFESQTLKKVGLNELWRMIREEEPPTPSQRLNTLAVQVCSTVSDQRGVDGRRLGQALRGELDWIVMKALEKDRNRRYESASAFAADVQRYLNDEAVSACPPSAGYRLRKFARRNQHVLVTVGIVVFALLTATAVSSWQALEARKAQRQAEADRDRATAAERQAEAINEFLQRDLIRQVNGDEQRKEGHLAQSNLTVKEAVNRAAAKIGERFRDQPLVEAAIRKVIGQAYQSIGEDRLGVAHLERSAELYHIYLGPDHPETLSSRCTLALAYQFVGRLPDAIALLQEVWEKRQAIHGPDHEWTLATLNCLGEACRKAGQLDRARLLVEEALDRKKAALGPDNPVTLNSLHDLGLVYRDLGRWEEALALLEEATRKLESVCGPNHSDTLYSLINLVKVYEKIGKFDQAGRLLCEFLHRQEKDDLRNPDYCAVLGVHLGQSLLNERKPAEAESVLRESVRIHERLKDDSPRRSFALSLLGQALVDQQRYADGEPLLLRGYEELKEYNDRRHVPAFRRPKQAEAGERIVRFYERTNHAEKARAWQERLLKDGSKN